MNHVLGFDWINRRRANRCWVVLPALLLSSVVAGCGSGSDLCSVTGQVTYQGKPLEQGSIVFVSPTSRQVTGEIASGEILKVTTTQTGDGIAAGEYLVAISSLDRSEKHRNSMSPPSLIPTRYSDATTSGLKATILPNEVSALRFDLK
jgi:hypothetical protein